MDPSLFLHYTTPHGIPQESKLATYMKMTPPTQLPAHPMMPETLDEAVGKLFIKPLPQHTVMPEFIPVTYYAPPPMMPESPPQLSPLRIMQHHQACTTQVHQENVGGTTYFYPTSSPPDPMMSGPIGNINMLGGECLRPVSVMPMRSGMSPYAPIYAPPPPQQHISPSMAGHEIPGNLGLYTDLIPLENTPPHCLTSSFRVTNRQNATYCAMRRIHSNPLGNTNGLEVWKNIDHPNIIKLHEYFTTKAFNDDSLVMIYDYHAGCSTLLDNYLSGGITPMGMDNTYADPFSSDPDAPRPYTHQKNAMLRAVACGVLLPESLLWSILVQLTGALRTIHHAGLACRTLDLSKVVINGNRVRIAWGGVGDMSHCSLNGGDLAHAQEEDLRALGRMTMSLACRTFKCDNFAASIEIIARTYSADLKNIVIYLSTSTGRRCVNDLMPMIGARFYTQVESLERQLDEMDKLYTREIDNGRLLRIIIKMGLVNERPELNLDQCWSETGDRYLLKLFRDYLFHAVNSNGQPWIDMAHITHCLNQLDGGTNNKIGLISRDEQSMLVVSFAELKHCLEQAVSEIIGPNRDQYPLNI